MNSKGNYSKRMMGRITFGLAILLLFCTYGLAQTPQIDIGVNWLRSSQAPDGSWGSVNNLRDTAEVLNTYNLLKISDANGLNWLNSASIEGNDFIARKIIALAGTGADISADITKLTSTQNADGGWGYFIDYESNVQDTALALHALQPALAYNSNAVVKGLQYLITTQNPDGSWNILPNEPGDISTTSLAVLILSEYRHIYLLENYINEGITYLKSKQNPDGGFGTSPSTVYDTALAFLALVESGANISSVAPQVINYIASTQLPNGSWNDDPYSTALALRVLANVKPNLSITPTDITFSTPTPKVGDTITVTAIIYNEGPAVANNIVIQFFDGDPSSGGILIGEATIATIPPYESSQASASWTIPTASARKVFVKIDPQNSIDELDETDNVAFNNLTSSTLPDLTLGSSDIAFSPDPPRLGEPITLSITVRNNGQSGTEAFSVYVYAGDPAQGGVKIGETTYSYLAGGGSGTFQIPWTVIEGVDRMTVKVDAQNQVSESNEDNNEAYRLLNSVLPPVEGVDLVAVPDSFSFSSMIPQEENPVTIAAMLQNNGTLGTTNVEVVFYDGDILDPANRIYSMTIPFLDAVQKRTISFQHTFPQGTKGAHTITMVVDPQNMITEANENNNAVSASIEVIELSNEIEQTIPRNLRGTSTQNSITLRWDAATRFYFGGYVVYRDGVRQNDTPITLTTYTDTGLPSGTLYHYQVTSVDEWGGNESPKSNTLAISTVIDNIDLKVDYKDVTITPQDAQTGQTVTISAKIHNLGTDPVSNVTVTMYTLDGPISTVNVPSIGAGGEYIVQMNWIVTDPNEFIYIQIDPENALLEMDEFNNLAITSVIKNVHFTLIDQALKVGYRALGDLDNDGDLDVLNSNAYYLGVNDGHGNFTYLTKDQTGFRSANDYSAAFGDVDNDGYLDVFICNTWAGDNRLYRNNGNLTFTDITQQANLKSINTYTVNAVFGDLNNDGKLDLFVGAYGGGEYIYLNNGNGTFTRVMPTIPDGYENVELGDLDGDGYLDAVVCATDAIVYKNDGTGHFTKQQTLPGSAWDVAIGDMDNDGYLDIITLNPGRVFYNDGNGNFSSANSVLLPRYGGYTVNVADFDNDGDLDILYSSNGYLLRNDGNRKFNDISALFNSTMPSYTIVLGDIDNDGDIDMIGAYNIYRNEMNNNNYLIFSLRGAESNYYGIGSTISVYEEGHLGERDHLKGFKQVQAGGQGYVSQDSSDAHFGVNSNYKYDVQVVFPSSGIVVNRRSTTTGQKLILPEIGDASIQSDDISFSPNSPLVGEKVVMTARIHNPTAIDMDNVTVGFYDGDPAAGGVELGRLTMAYVPAQGNKDFPIEASFTEGIHEIYVVIDPDNAILETDKTNNKASNTLTVVARIIEQDLSVSASDIGIDPVAPWDGAQVTVSAVVHCSGESDIENVNVSFYDGDPTQGGLLIGPAKISSIPVNGSAQTQIQWDTLGKSGLHYIHVVADPLNLIRETNENNNLGIISVDVTPPAKPDLVIASSDIALSNASPGEGETITLQAAVHNLGLQTSNVDVALYDGDPSAGGRFLARSTNMQIIPSGGTGLFSFEVNTIGLSGVHNFFVSVDPDNRIDEMLETNNLASNLATIGQAGLGLGIVTDKATYTANEDVQITVNLNNLLNVDRSGTLEIEILDLSGNVVSTMVNNEALTLGPNEQRAANYLWNTSQTLSGDYKASCDFIEAGNVVARAESAITIAPVKAVGSSVFADKISYLSNRPVTITSTIQSASANTIFSSLIARIDLLNSQGTTLFSDTKTIPFLAPGQRVELKTYWNTSLNPRGTYTVRLEALEGESLLGTSTATFEILGSSQTSEGILGMITAQPNLLYQGKDEILSYSVTNNGNEDISDLTVKVLIVNPDTQEVKNTLESSLNLLMGTTSTDNFIASTSNLPPRTYLAILQASSATMTQPKTIASTVFMVIQAITLPFFDNFDSYAVGASAPAPWFELCEGQAVITSAESYSGQNSIMTGGQGNSHCAMVGLGETYPDRISYEVQAKVNLAGSSAYIGFFEEIADVVPQFNTVYFNGADGKVYFYSADKDHGFLVPILDSFAAGIWYKVRVEIDFSILTGDVYINDVMVAQSLPVSPKEAVWEYNGTHSFQLNKIGVLHYLGEPLYFDDFSVFERRNHPPIADAGLNMAIFGNMQYSTVIQGMASDPDNDPMSYRWLEGQNELIPWRPVGPNGESYLELGSVPAFALGEHILSLEVDDGNDISGDDMILTVNNSAPHPAPAGGGVCEINTQFPLKGQISDYDGDIVNYRWSEADQLLFGGSIQTLYGGTPVNLPEYLYQCSVLGEHTVSLWANDGVNQTVNAQIHISVTDSSVPILAPVPDQNILWPPNHKMVTVIIQANAGDNSGGPVLLSALVFSNEPQNGLGDGDESPDWTEPVIDQVNGVITLQLRAERSGSGNGRIYTVRITATDTSGNSSYGDVNIIVPHDQGN